MALGLKIGLILSVLVLVGCASRQSGWDKKGVSVTLSDSETKALRAEAMSLWNKRDNKESLEEALSKYELIHAANPEELDSVIYLTRGYYFLADAHIQDIEQKKKMYEKAASFGEIAMATNADFKGQVSKGVSVEDALDTLTEKEVPAMYWTAASLGKWAKSSGITAQLKYKTRIMALIKHVEKLAPDYFYSAPSRYWGGFYAVAPSFAGGDLKKSKEQFEKSLKLAPEYLGTKVLMAEVYWTKKEDKKAFENMLRDVLTASEKKNSEIGPENTMEKKKAEKLLERMDELF